MIDAVCERIHSRLTRTRSGVFFLFWVRMAGAVFRSGFSFERTDWASVRRNGLPVLSKRLSDCTERRFWIQDADLDDQQASGRCSRDFAGIELECALPFQEALRREFPESHARVRWTQEAVFSETDDVIEALARCARLRAMEAAGEWVPPTQEDLLNYRAG